MPSPGRASPAVDGRLGARRVSLLPGGSSREALKLEKPQGLCRRKGARVPSRGSPELTEISSSDTQGAGRSPW